VSAFCTECGDEFSPVEYAPVPVDPDEPRFCSSACEALYACQRTYGEARYSGAPVR
jgi:hypothetical protein